IAAIDISAVGGEGINLIRRIEPFEEAVAVSTIGVAPNDHHIPVAARPLALDPDELWSQVEDQVIAFDCVCAPHADAELCSLARYCQFRDRSFLICCKHVVQRSNDIGWAVAVLDHLPCNNILRTLERVSLRTALVGIALLLLGI